MHCSGVHGCYYRRFVAGDRGPGRLNEGLEAMDMLNFGRPGEVNEESEISKMWNTKFQQVRCVAWVGWRRSLSPLSAAVCILFFSSWRVLLCLMMDLYKRLRNESYGA